MHRMTVLAAAGAVAVVVGVISFTLGRAMTAREPVAATIAPKVADAELVTGTIASTPIFVQAQSTRPIALPPTPSPAAFPATGSTDAIPAPSPPCKNPDALGVSRVVEIDTAGGPGFGFEQFKAYDFLREHEVVLTFDDGPWPGNTAGGPQGARGSMHQGSVFPHRQTHHVASRNSQAGGRGGTHDRIAYLVARRFVEIDYRPSQGRIRERCQRCARRIGRTRGVVLSLPGAAQPT